MGIASRYLDDIFDPYFSTKRHGSGLGLASTHSIISKHNGAIMVDSKLNQGSTFTIRLPASKETGKKAAVESSEEVSGAAVSPIRILSLDDEETVRDVLKAMLERMGFNASFAVEGLEAIAKYREAFESGAVYDLVTVDLTIPGGMGGQEASREILKINPRAKIIVSSGYATDPVMANYEQYGFKGVVAKPYLYAKLREVVEHVLHQTS